MTTALELQGSGFGSEAAIGTGMLGQESCTFQADKQYGDHERRRHSQGIDNIDINRFSFVCQGVHATLYVAAAYMGRPSQCRAMRGEGEAAFEYGHRHRPSS